MCSCLFLLLFGLNFCCRFTRREIDGMNRTGRTSGFTLTAKAALVVVDICHVVFYRNSLKSALFLTLAASDAGIQAGFARYGSFVFIDAFHNHTSALRTFFSQFDDVSRTSLHALTASGTLVLIHFG